MFFTKNLAIIFIFILFQPLATSGDFRIGPVYADKFPQMEIIVETPAKLTAQSLTLVEDGQATVAASGVRPFKETGRGMAVVLALDVSGTMAGQPISDMKRALSAFLNQAGKQDRVAIMTFADDVRVDAKFGSSPEQLKAAVNGLAVRGRITELFKGLRDALLLLDAAGLPERKRLIVISDGFDEGKAYKQEDVIEEALRRNVSVDAVGLTKVDPMYLSNLNRIADKTGGNYQRAENSEKLEGIFRQGIERLQTTPVATFTASKLQADGQEHRINVRLEANGRLVTANETTLILNKPGSPSASPTPAATQPGGVKGFFSRLPKWAWIAAVGGLIAIVLLTVLLRRRSRSARSAVTPPSSAVSYDEPTVADTGKSSSPASPYDLPPVTEPLFDSADEVAELREFSEFRTQRIASQNVGGHVGDQAVGGHKFDGTLVDPLPQPDPQQARVRRKTQIRTEFAAPAPGKPCAMLMAEEGSQSGAVFSIEVSPFWIGSEEASQLWVEGDTFLSGFHACIEFKEGTLLLHDNNSTNGTFLNGQPVKDTPRSLSYGDRIKTGRSIFVVTRA
ncbi:MAG: VWA domain-containing protein [Blastocatellia bacterium]